LLKKVRNDELELFTVTKLLSNYSLSLIEASLDPLITINIEGKITDMNEATVKITGVKREELIGSDFFDYFTQIWHEKSMRKFFKWLCNRLSLLLSQRRKINRCIIQRICL
jgi:PAS domain S-box-containing protein